MTALKQGFPAGFWEGVLLADAVAPFARKLQAVFIYGSIAAGHEDTASDIDLLVIGNVSSVDLAVPLRKANESLGRDINPSIYSPVEFAKKREGSFPDTGIGQAQAVRARRSG